RRFKHKTWKIQVQNLEDLSTGLGFKSCSWCVRLVDLMEFCSIGIRWDLLVYALVFVLQSFWMGSCYAT
ncbi:hypothetical protein MKW98_021959, partial [Papaver atlanticum]